MGGQASFAKASQPATPVYFEIPANACDCHSHIFGDPEKFPFWPGRSYTPETPCEPGLRPAESYALAIGGVDSGLTRSRIISCSKSATELARFPASWLTR